MSLRVTEVFRSLQGEGVRQGTPMTFVRLTGCPLRCQWCDTTYSFGGGTVVEVPQLLELIADLGCQWVSLTGGEPMAQDLNELVDELLAAGYAVHLETSGSEPIDQLRSHAKVHIAMDVKCPSSGMVARNRYENLALLKESDEVKFVVADEEDLRFVQEVLANHPIPCTAVLQPVWGQMVDPVVERLQEQQLAGTLLRWQLHKQLWGERAGV